MMEGSGSVQDPDPQHCTHVQYLILLTLVPVLIFVDFLKISNGFDQS
jgi:hypothetical protein